MANQVDPRLAGIRPQVDASAGYDEGLRSYMLSIYNYMASGVLLTGIVALLVANNAALLSVFYAQDAAGRIGPTIAGWIAMLSPLALVLVMNFGVNRLSEGQLKACFWGFAGLMGVSMSTIFVRYTGASIAQTFFVTAASYGALSLYGYTTKRDLSAMGKFLMMGLIGLLVATLANFFFKSGPLQLAINIIGTLIFAGLTAYDTQRLKGMYYELQGSAFIGKSAVLGALTMYLNFINLFQFLLSFMGDRR
ncbi:MAG: Bax inhibitor-1/YccA family protein [Polymorphobacter sp.]